MTVALDSNSAINVQHFSEVFKVAGADAALAASIFHFKEVAIPELKLFLKRKNVGVRL